MKLKTKVSFLHLLTPSKRNVLVSFVLFTVMRRMMGALPFLSNPLFLLQIHTPFCKHFSWTKTSNAIRLNGVAESSSFKLRSANKVVCCDRELPTLSLVGNGKVKKVVYADALVIGMEEFVLHAQHPSFGRENI